MIKTTKMMKKIFNIALLTTIVLLFNTSCASWKQTGPVMTIKGNNINTYVAADLDYENAKRVEATMSFRSFCGISTKKNGNKTFHSSTRYKWLTKQEAKVLYKAKQEAGVDIILDPEFSVERHSYFFGLSVRKKITVKGWGVNIKGIKEDNSQNARL